MRAKLSQDDETATEDSWRTHTRLWLITELQTILSHLKTETNFDNFSACVQLESQGLQVGVGNLVNLFCNEGEK